MRLQVCTVLRHDTVQYVSVTIYLLYIPLAEIMALQITASVVHF